MKRNRSNNNESYVEKYPPEVQKLYLDYLIGNTDTFMICRNILKPSYFDEKLRSAVAFILDYADTYREIPAIEQIKAITGTTLEKPSETSPEHRKWLLDEVQGFCRRQAIELAILESPDLLERERESEIETRIKNAMEISLITDLGLDYFADPRARLEAMREDDEFVSTGWQALDKKLYGGFAKGTISVFCGGSGCVVAGTKVRVKRLNDPDSEARDVNIETLGDVNTGEEYLCDSPDGWVPIELWRNKGVKQAYTLNIKTIKDATNTASLIVSFSTITASDDHLFQLVSGEWVYTRNLARGDSLLSNGHVATVTSITDAGNQVVYDLAIGHENHRYYTNGISSHNSGKSLFLQNLALNWSQAGLNVIYFSLELSQKLVSKRLDAMISGRGTKDVFSQIDAVADIIEKQAVKAGKLVIKVLSSGATANDIRAYLKQYELETGIKIDAICVDYLDLMYPTNGRIDPSDMFVKDKYTSEELRGLSVELDVICATASQLNRGSIAANGEFDQSHIAGGISKINTADNVFAIFTTLAMKEKGLYELNFLKTRTAAAVGQKIELAYDPVSMRITDMKLDLSDVPTDKPKSIETLRQELSNKTTTPTLLKDDEPEVKKAPSAMDLIAKLKKSRKAEA